MPCQPGQASACREEDSVSIALEADGAGLLSGMPGIESQIFSLFLLRIEPCHPPRVTSHHTEAKAPVTSPNLQQLQRSVCLCVSMYVYMCTCVLWRQRLMLVSSLGFLYLFRFLIFKITFYLFCICMCTYMRTHICHGMHVVVRGQLEEIGFLLPSTM